MNQNVMQLLQDRKDSNQCIICAKEMVAKGDTIVLVHPVVGEVRVHTNHIKKM
jgi:hypothetical protein